MKVACKRMEFEIFSGLGKLLKTFVEVEIVWDGSYLHKSFKTFFKKFKSSK